MNFMVSDYLFQGPIAEYTVDQLIDGFTADVIAERVSGGSVTSGNLHYRPEVAPVYLSLDPAYSDEDLFYTVNTGAADPHTGKTVGVIEALNGVDFAN